VLAAHRIWRRGQGCGCITVNDASDAVDPDPAGGGLVQAGDHPHRGRFAGPVRAEKASHDTGPDNKVQAVDRKLLPVSLADVLYLDHRMFLSSVVSWHHQR
jgi:hypothetical protein